MEKIKVIIADDSDFVRDGMKIILDLDDAFEVLGSAANGREAIDLAEKERPDVFLMDIQMPVMDGIEATKYIVERDMGKVLILTTFDDDELVQQALRNGAAGYLIKNHTPEHLKQMIKSVYHGTGVMEGHILQTLAGKGEQKESASAQPESSFDPSGYSEREMDIIRAVAEGLSNKEIADKLFISEGTVKNYISNILSKEGLAHRTALAVYYLTGNKNTNM
ncbi:MAG: response regulator transcription factor [Lachnospiraceae bacterium]|nr:response regulator transcription factor [Lachnospiraceae bacterium]